jgi:hypothetical protein
MVALHMEQQVSASAATVPPGDSEAERGRPGSGRLAGGVVLGLLVLAAVALNVLHIARYDTFGPIDELQHLDAAIRAPSGDFIGAGDVFSQEAMRTESCRGVDAPGVVLPPCPVDDSVILDPSLYQEGGYNTAYIHPPTYYLIDGALGRVIHSVLPGHHDLLTSVRLAGLVWVVLEVVALWLLLAEVGADLWRRSALILLVVGSLAVLEATATVNIDATSIPLGAAALWAVLRWERSKVGWWLPVGLAALCAFTKVTNLLGIGVVLLYLVIRAVTTLRATDGGTDTTSWRVFLRPRALPDAVRRYVVLIGLTGIALVVPSVFWLACERFLQVVPPSTIPMLQRFRITTFPWAELSSSWKQGVSPLSSPNHIPELTSGRSTFWVAAVDATLMVVAVAGTIVAGKTTRLRAVGASVLTVAVLVGPAIVVFNAVVQSIYVVVPPRYALSIVPALVAVGVAALARRRLATTVVSLVAVGSYVSILWALI